MHLKMENAAEDSAAVVDGIAGLFSSMCLPRLADKSLYLGAPLPVLEGFRQALAEQRSEDEKKRFANKLRYAGIAKERTANTFAWGEGSYPLAEPGAIEDALAIGFIRQRRNLMLAGPPGAGKSLLAAIIACKAIREGFSVRYKTAHDIAMEIGEAKDGNSLSGYIRKLQACDVLIIEDLTFATFDSRAAQSFFSVIDKRYGRKTTAITSNGNINEWARGLPDENMGAALLGRFYEEALLVNMNGCEDMRLRRAKGMLGAMGKGASGAAGGA